MNDHRNFKSLLMIGLMLAGVLTGLSVPVASDIEPNDDFANAETLTLGTPVSGTSTGANPDYYKFPVANAQKINATLEITSGINMWGEMYKPNQMTAESSGYLISPTNYTMYHTTSSADPGDYFYSVEGDGTYTLTITTVDQDDAGSGGDAGDLFADAMELAPGTYDGWIADADLYDYYKFAVANAQKITVTLEAVSGDSQFWGELYKPDQGSIRSTGYIIVGYNETVELTTSSADPGFYYYSVENGQGDYRLSITITDQNDAGGGGDSGDTFTDALVITPGTISGWIADADFYDYYKFAVADAQKITVTLEAVSGDSQFWGSLYRPNQNSITSTSYITVGFNETIEFTTSSAEPGDYYFMVENGQGDYGLVLAIVDQDDAGSGGDAGDSDTDALAITPGTYDGWVADDDMYDYYKFEVSDADIITVTLENGIAGEIQIYGTLLNPLKSSAGTTGYITQGLSATIEYTTSYATTGTYYFMIETGNKDYKLTLNVTPQNDANSGLDAMDDFPGLEVLEGDDHPGWLADDDQKDYYGVNLTNGQIINLTLTPGTETDNQLYMSLYDPAKEKLGSTGYLNPEISGTISFTTSYETAGMYTFLVENAENDYTFDVVITDQDDGGSGMDAPEDLAAAVSYVEGTTHGFVADIDKADAYNFTVKAGNVFTLNLTTGGSGTNLITVDIFDAQKVKIDTMMAAPGVTESYTLPVAKAPATNSLFYIKVSGDGQPYTLDLTLPTTPPDTTPPTVKILTPLNGLAYKLPTVTVTGTATDDGTVTKLEASIDNATWTDCTGQGAWTCIINLSSGANKVTVRATDAGNNHGYDNITLHLDGTPPTVQITTPTNGSKVKKKTIQVSGTAQDNIGLATVEIIVNDGTPITASGIGTWAADVILKKGENTITVRVTDTAGNTAEETVTIKYKKEEKQQPGFESVVFLGAMVVALVVLTTLRRRK